MIDQYKTIGAKYSDIKLKPSVSFTEVASVLKFIGQVQSLDVIDLACGTGFYSRLIKKQGARRVLGVDLSSNMIKAAQDEEIQSPSGIEYLVCDIQSLTVRNEFNLAIAIWLLHYATTFEQLERICLRIGNCLRGGSRLVAVVPNPRFSNGLLETEIYGYRTRILNPGRDIPMVMMEFLQGSAPYAIEYCQWSFIHYHDALKEAGFSNIECHDIPVSQQGIEQMGEDYWLIYKRNPLGIIITAEYKGNHFWKLYEND